MKPKKRIGRPPLKNPRVYQICVRVTRQEAVRLKREAAAEGKELATLIRERVLGS
jgi:hypothetical protein